MTLTGRLIRIKRDGVRIPLLLAIMPFEIARFAVLMAIHAPHRFFKLEAWDNTTAIWRMALLGDFAE